MSEELPKLELLIKLMKMTTASNDGEALNAIRKVNGILSTDGWDWEDVLRSKVTVKVFEDPFKGMDLPQQAPAAARNQVPRASPPRQRPVPPRGPKVGDTRNVLGGVETWDGFTWVFKPTPVKPQPTPPPKPTRADPRFFRAKPSDPVVFTKYADGRWVIKSPIALNEGRKATVSKRDGTTVEELCGSFIEQDVDGYFLYRIGSKQRAKFADQLNINDLI